MTKYSIPDGHYEDDEKESQPEYLADTSVNVKIDVTLHEQGYQNDEKWTVHCQNTQDGLLAGYAVKHQNKGNYWREGDIADDAVDFADLPLRVRRRVAVSLNRRLKEITPGNRVIEE